MYNPDQHYEAHTLHLKDLYEQVEQRRMISALPKYRHARVRTVGRRLGVVLVRLGTWLACSTTSSRSSLRWHVARKLASWRRAAAMPSACANTRGMCDAGSNQSSACRAPEICISCIPR